MKFIGPDASGATERAAKADWPSTPSLARPGSRAFLACLAAAEWCNKRGQGAAVCFIDGRSKPHIYWPRVAPTSMGTNRYV